MAVTDAWLAGRIAYTQTLLEAQEAAMLSFYLNGAQQEYTYNTGQQDIRVERADFAKMSADLDRVYNRYVMFCVRAGQTPAALSSVPSW